MTTELPRVLVIDDEPAIGQNCVKILSRMGVQAEYVLNGFDALKRMEETPYDVLVTDLKMSRMGGMEARVGMTKVPDHRLEALARIFEPPKVTFATVEYLDFPAISKEALANPQFVGSLRVADAFAQVLRVFQDETVPHEHGSIDPLRDADDLETELILSDLVVVEKRMERVDKDRKKHESTYCKTCQTLWGPAVNCNAENGEDQQESEDRFHKYAGLRSDIHTKACRTHTHTAHFQGEQTEEHDTCNAGS